MIPGPRTQSDVGHGRFQSESHHVMFRGEGMKVRADLRRPSNQDFEAKYALDCRCKGLHEKVHKKIDSSDVCFHSMKVVILSRECPS